jgi:hypothetical protein
MDFEKLDRELDKGKKIAVTYEYPSTVRDKSTGSIYRQRTDELLDVAPERKRLFVRYKGKMPIWIEAYEVIRIEGMESKS